MWPEKYAVSVMLNNFYSHIPCGMWPSEQGGKDGLLEFLLTHPVWDVTQMDEQQQLRRYHFYSHIPCGMWPMRRRFCRRNDQISTHTSRVGCDDWKKHCQISKKFLLTHPVWDVTSLLQHRERIIRISTHTSRVGCDEVHKRRLSFDDNFYSHIPCGMWQLYIVYFNHIIPIYYRMDL